MRAPPRSSKPCVNCHLLAAEANDRRPHLHQASIGNMCILLIAVDRIDGWPLLLLGNRDEFFARATAPAQPWREAPDCLGGRDLVAGGSWLLQRNDGRFAAVTNMRTGLPASAQRSRGALVRDFVVGGMSIAAFVENVTAQVDEYGPFNLVLGDGAAVWVIDGASASSQRLRRGVHVISNGAFGLEWPKVLRLRERFEKAIAGGLPEDASLLALLADSWQPEDAQLPDTGIGLAHERMLAPIFIRGALYGTRACTLVLRHEDGGLFVRERIFAADAGQVDDVAWQCTDAESEWLLI